MTFGKWLHERRTARGLTQEKAAASAGITRAMLAKLEGDRTGTTRKTLERLAVALGVDIEEMAARYGSGRFIGEDTEITYLLSDLSPAQRRIVLNVAKATRESLLAV